jgi:hypothetical protein
MSRKPRVHFPEVVYHVISRGWRRKYQTTPSQTPADLILSICLFLFSVVLCG